MIGCPHFIRIRARANLPFFTRKSRKSAAPWSISMTGLRAAGSIHIHPEFIQGEQHATSIDGGIVRRVFVTADGVRNALQSAIGNDRTERRHPGDAGGGDPAAQSCRGEPAR
jgi:hypothetical protein